MRTNGANTCFVLVALVLDFGECHLSSLFIDCRVSTDGNLTNQQQLNAGHSVHVGLGRLHAKLSCYGQLKINSRVINNTAMTLYNIMYECIPVFCGHNKLQLPGTLHTQSPMYEIGLQCSALCKGSSADDALQSAFLGELVHSTSGYSHWTDR